MTAHILVVEEDVLVRHPLAQYLRECGYTVSEARDGAEARILIDAQDVAIDMLFAEGESGFELARWVRQRHPDVAVIIAGTVTRAVEMAGDLCEDGPAITKPYDHQFLLSRIQQLLAKRGHS
jgi:DNA-binding response OmpR family regulator